MKEKNISKLFRLPPSLISKFEIFFAVNKSRLGFTDQSNCAKFLLEIGLEESENVLKAKEVKK